MRHHPERVLFVLFGAIGDVTRALPLLNRVRCGYPRAQLIWAVEPLAAPLLEEHPALDGRIVFARQHGVRGFVSFLRAVRRQRFDLVLDLGRQLKSGVTALASGATLRIGFHRQNSREGNWCFQTETIGPQEHYSSKLQQYLRFADHLGLDEAPLEFGLAPSPRAQERVRELLQNVGRPFAAFILGSSCPSRRWFPERTSEVADALWKLYGYPPVLLGTTADRPFAMAVKSRTRASVRDLVGLTTLEDVVGVLDQAALAISPDSGAMHIAAALGTPVISLWGATSASRSAPFGFADAVLTGAAECAPCYLKRCPIGRVCMRGISSDDVLARAAAIVDGACRVAT